MKTRILILKNTVLGIMLGLTMISISLTLVLLLQKDVSDYLTKESLLTNMGCSAVIGIVFYVGSIVYRYDKISPLFQVMIHLGLGLMTTAIGAYIAKWIPIEDGPIAIILFALAILIVSFGIWFGFYLYYKNEAKKINQKIKQM